MSFEKKSIVETIFHAKFYLMGSVIGILLSFITIPLITYNLTPEEYGIYSIFINWVPIILVCINLNTSVAIERFFFEKNIIFEDFLGTNIVISTAILLTISFIIFLNKVKVASILEIPIELILPMLVVVSVQLFNGMYLSLLKNKRESKKVLYITTFISIINLLFIYLFIKSLNDNLYWAPIMALATVTIIQFTISVYGLIKMMNVCINRKYIQNIFYYSIPLIFVHLFAYGLEKIDTVMIAKFINRADAGLYAYSYKLGMLPFLGISALLVSWRPKFYDYMNSEQYEICDKEISIQMWVCVLLVTLFIFYGDLLGKIIAPEKYHDSLILIPMISLSCFFVAINEIYKRIFEYAKKPLFISFIYFVGATANVLMNLILIPKYGYKVAGLTTLISYSILFFTGYCLAVYILKVKYTGFSTWLLQLITVVIVALGNYGLLYLNLNIAILMVIKVIITLIVLYFIWKVAFRELIKSLNA